MKNNRLYLKIADTIISIISEYAIEHSDINPSPLPKESRSGNSDTDWRLSSFVYKGSQKPSISIEVIVTKKLPRPIQAKHIFTTKHFQDGKENWRLLRHNNDFIYTCPLKSKKQFARLNKDFTKAVIYVRPKKTFPKNGRKKLRFTWDPSDIIYDFLQILMIQYFIPRGGFFAHGVGIKDVDKKGLLFLGKSGCGKTTTAKLWYKHTKAAVLNDDRIIIRRIKNSFFIYGTPWHGDFSDYLASGIERAKLERLFFIHHGKRNIAKQVRGKKSFAFLFPAIFPPFWSKEGLMRTTSLCLEVINRIPCYRMGFTKDKEVIRFTRQISKVT